MTGRTTGNDAHDHENFSGILLFFQHQLLVFIYRVPFTHVKPLFEG